MNKKILVVFCIILMLVSTISFTPIKITNKATAEKISIKQEKQTEKDLEEETQDCGCNQGQKNYVTIQEDNSSTGMYVHTLGYEWVHPCAVQFRGSVPLWSIGYWSSGFAVDTEWHANWEDYDRYYSAYEWSGNVFTRLITDLEPYTTYHFRAVGEYLPDGDTYQGQDLEWSQGNTPPAKPSKPDGENTGVTGVPVSFSTSSTDPSQDDIRYGWSWNGAWPVDEYTDYIASGSTITTDHVFEEAGEYEIWVVALDHDGCMSSPSESKMITIYESGNNNPPYPASNPSPGDGETHIDLSTVISWDGGDPDGDSVTYDVYFGKISNPPRIESGTTSTVYNPPGNLDYATWYYWKIVSKDSYGETIEGETWSFRTVSMGNNPPELPTNPRPSDGGTNIKKDITMRVDVSDPDYDDMVVKFYNANNDNIIGTTMADSGGTAKMAWTGLSYKTTYKWYVTADDGTYTTKSPTWSFITREKESINIEPNAPDITEGPDSIQLDVEYDFKTVSYDPDFDDILYMFDWGDGISSEWLGPYENGEICSASHVWTEEGDFTIRVKAKDIDDLQSDWSDLKVVSVFKDKSSTKDYLFFEALFDLFPFLKLVFSNFRFFSSFEA